MPTSSNFSMTMIKVHDKVYGLVRSFFVKYPSFIVVYSTGEVGSAIRHVRSSSSGLTAFGKLVISSTITREVVEPGIKGDSCLGCKV